MPNWHFCGVGGQILVFRAHAREKKKARKRGIRVTLGWEIEKFQLFLVKKTLGVFWNARLKLTPRARRFLKIWEFVQGIRGKIALTTPKHIEANSFLKLPHGYGKEK